MVEEGWACCDSRHTPENHNSVTADQKEQMTPDPNSSPGPAPEPEPLQELQQNQARFRLASVPTPALQLL